MTSWKTFAHISVVVVLFILLIYKCSLYSLDISPLSNLHVTNVYFQSTADLFTLFIGPVDEV